MTESKELVNTNGNDVIPFDMTPDYLPTSVKNTGVESLGKDDYKTPRIVLTQGLSPELETFQGIAKKDHFWHTGMNVNLGQEFSFIPITANKRVILFRPRNDQGGGILAFSKNGKTWDSGANQTFQAKIKGRKEPVSWNTRKDVLSSRLTEFGTSNPDEPHSAPAASVIYEYLVYLPEHPELSPCVIGLSKTAIPNGKTFNTSLAMIARTGKPICSLNVRCFVENMNNDDGEWTVPNFKLMGWVGNKDLFNIVKGVADSYSDYNVDYTQEEVAPIVDDEIKY